MPNQAKETRKAEVKFHSGIILLYPVFSQSITLFRCPQNALLCQHLSLNVNFHMRQELKFSNQSAVPSEKFRNLIIVKVSYSV